MKIISWVEVALATPMVLAFSSMGGILAVGVASIVLGVVMTTLKWGQRLILPKKNVQELATVKVKAAN